MSKLCVVGIFAALSVALMSASCKETRSPEVGESISSIAGGVDGVVTLKYAKDGCDVLIAVSENGSDKFYIPVELDERYKLEGKKISFTFHSSRINQGNCLMGSPIIIDSIQAR